MHAETGCVNSALEVTFQRNLNQRMTKTSSVFRFRLDLMAFLLFLFSTVFTNFIVHPYNESCLSKRSGLIILRSGECSHSYSTSMWKTIAFTFLSNISNIENLWEIFCRPQGNLKPRLHIRFPHAFSAWHCDFS
jgi:hypothetical protein